MKFKRTKDSGVVIRISGLSNSIHNYSLSVDPNALGLSEQFRDKIEIDAELDKSTHQIFLKAKIDTTGLFQCDRCLEEFQKPVSVLHKICYVYNEKDGGAFPPEELQVINPDTVSIDLTEDIRQAISVSVPLKLLCSEECRGLCRHCGTNLNCNKCECEEDTTDPRWQGLRDLLHK